jgi:hypothetical protein
VHRGDGTSPKASARVFGPPTDRDRGTAGYTKVRLGVTPS